MALGQMTPGPDWVLVTRWALAHGFRSAVWTATGIAIGLMLHAAVAVGGLAVYVRKSEALWLAARWLAAGYLLWIAFGLVRPGKRLAGEGEPAVRRRPFLQGLLCNVLNAKVSLLLAAVCAFYLRGEHAPWWPWLLWAVIVIQGWTLWVAWAALLQVKSVRSAYAMAQQWLDASFAVALLALAVRLMTGG